MRCSGLSGQFRNPINCCFGVILAILGVCGVTAVYITALAQLDRHLGVSDRYAVVVIGSVLVEVNGDALKKYEHIAKVGVTSVLAKYGGTRVSLPEYESDGFTKKWADTIRYQCSVTPEDSGPMPVLHTVCWERRWMGDRISSREEFRSREPGVVATFIRDYGDFRKKIAQ